MEEAKFSDVEFLRRLNRHPNLRTRMETLLNIAEASVEAGEMTADEAEIQLREQVRGMGQEALQEWATSKERTISAKTEEDIRYKKYGKKKSTGIQHLEG